jgi:hypothetical protein
VPSGGSPLAKAFSIGFIRLHYTGAGLALALIDKTTLNATGPAVKTGVLEQCFNYRGTYARYYWKIVYVCGDTQ